MLSRKSRMFMLLTVAVAAVLCLNTVAAADQVELRVLNYLDLTGAAAQRELTDIWEAFEKNNPDIRVIREDLYDEPFHQKTEAYAAAGELPDVLYMWPGARSATLHDNKLVKDLTQLLGEEFLSNFSEAALVPQRAGYLACLPIGLTGSHVMFVNTKLLDELGLTIPQTYEELKAMVPILKENRKDTIIIGSQADWVMQSVFFSMLAGRLVGDEYIDMLVAGEAKFTDPQFVSVLKFYETLFEDGVFTRRVLMTPYGTGPSLFANERAPFFIDGDWQTGAFLTDPTTGEALFPPEKQKDIVLTVFPALPGEVNSNSSSLVPAVGFGINAAIPAGSAKEEAAVRLLKWLTSEEVQRVRLETGAAFPSRKGVTSDKLEPLAQERALFYGRHAGTYVLDNVLDPQIYLPLNTGLQEIGLGMATPEEVAAKMQQGYDEWKAGQ